MSLTNCPSDPALGSYEQSYYLMDFFPRGLKSNIVVNGNDLVVNYELNTSYPLLSQFWIYPDFRQSKHEDSSQWRKDPCPWKDNTLENNSNMNANLAIQTETHAQSHEKFKFSNSINQFSWFLQWIILSFFKLVNCSAYKNYWSQATKRPSILYE